MNNKSTLPSDGRQGSPQAVLLPFALYSERGYTLIEQVMVLGLVASLFTIGAVGIRGALAREEADGRVRALVYDIAAGQQAAITRRTLVVATFEDRTYTIAVADAAGSGVLRRETLPEHMTFGPGLQTVTFDRRGIPSAGLTIAVTSTSGRTFTIVVEEATGRVSYHEP